MATPIVLALNAFHMLSDKERRKFLDTILTPISGGIYAGLYMSPPYS
jgi:hypothetical protein